MHVRLSVEGKYQMVKPLLINPNIQTSEAPLANPAQCSSL